MSHLVDLGSDALKIRSLRKPSIFVFFSLYIFIIGSFLALVIVRFPVPELPVSETQATFDGKKAYGYVEYLCLNFQHRVIGSLNVSKAADWILLTFKGFGLEALTQNFSTYDFDGNLVTGINVVAISPGAVKDSIVIVAHRDVVPQTIQGAGTGAMLELARIFSNRSHKHTLIFLSADAEETGLVGSRYFVARFLEINHVKVVVSVDMMGFKDAKGIALYGISSRGKFSDAWPIALSLKIGERLGYNITVSETAQFAERLGLSSAGTDSQSFIEIGIPGIGVADAPEYPYVHTPQDSFDKISPERLRYVGSFVESFILSVDEMAETPVLGELYFFSGNLCIPELVVYLHFISYPIFKCLRLEKSFSRLGMPFSSVDSLRRR